MPTITKQIQIFTVFILCSVLDACASGGSPGSSGPTDGQVLASGGFTGSTGGASASGTGGVSVSGSGGTETAASGGTGNSGGGGADNSGGGSGAGNSSGGTGGDVGEPTPDAGSGDGTCGTRGGQRGKTLKTLTVGGTTRSYVAYLPQAFKATKALPLVYVFHGATQTGQNLYDATQYSALAESEGIAVVFPDGQGVSSATGTGVLAPWNVSDNGALVCGAGAFANSANPVDFAFLDAIKADIAEDQCLDTKHVFATGFSMGGYFTHHVACDRSDFRGAAPHSGGTIASLSACATKHMPVIIFHGTADPLIADGCDDPNGTSQSGFTASATLWAQKNGCQATYTTIPETGTSGSNGQCYLYDGCPADGQVELCTFTGLGHAWAGAATCPGCIGTGPNYVSATALEWSFFKKYAW
jgi:poly(3-hydroxybutyrate) depolymerase